MDEIRLKKDLDLCRSLPLLTHTFFPAGLSLKLPSVDNNHPLGLSFPLLEPASQALLHSSVSASLAQRSEHLCDQIFSQRTLRCSLVANPQSNAHFYRGKVRASSTPSATSVQGSGLLLCQTCLWLATASRQIAAEFKTPSMGRKQSGMSYQNVLQT